MYKYKQKETKALNAKWSDGDSDCCGGFGHMMIMVNYKVIGLRLLNIIIFMLSQSSIEHGEWTRLSSMNIGLGFLLED